MRRRARPRRPPAARSLAARLAAGVAAATALALTALLGAAPATPAGAHATLVGTAPAADALLDAVPADVELRFDEPVEAADDALRVVGPDGDRVDRGEVAESDGGAVLRGTIDDGGRGTYTVAWRVTSEDSHTITGSLVFHVGTRTGAATLSDPGGTATDVVGGVGRWLGFAGALVGAGAAALALLPGARSDGDGEDRAGPDRGGAASRRLRRLAVGGAAVGVAGVLVALVAVLAEGAGRGLWSAVPLVVERGGDTRTGRLALLRAGVGALAAGAALATPVWRRSPAPAAVLGVASLVLASLAGHAWTAPDRWVAVAADTAHLTALALWAGGLVALAATLPVAGDRARLARRFSALAPGGAGVVAVSGVVSGWQQVRSLDALTGTGYGQLLLAKVAGFTVLVGLGWLNRTHLVPLVERAVAPLATSLRAEVGVAAVVLALTASMIHQPPARTTWSEPFDVAVERDGGTMEATVDPARTGGNDIHLTFNDDAGRPLNVDAVQVTAGTDGVPARRLEVTPLTPNHVTVSGASLPSPGTWDVEVTAVREGVPLAFPFEVPIR